MHIFRRLAFLIILLTLTFPGQAQDAVVLDIIQRVNQARTQTGIPGLLLNAALMEAAQRHSRDMAATGSLSHTGSDGSEFWQRIQAAGYPLTNGAENILVRPDADPAGAYQQWYSSPQHQANMLNPAYVEIGVGYAESDAGAVYFTMLLAARADVTPPSLTLVPAPSATSTIPPLTATSSPVPPAPSETVLPPPTGTPLPVVTATPVPTATSLPTQPVMQNHSPTPADSKRAEIAQALRDSFYYFSVALVPVSPPAPTPVLITPATVTVSPSATPVLPESADLRLVYNADSFALINISGRKLNLTPLTFESSSGTLEATRWQTEYLTEPLNAFTPDDCLQVWSLDNRSVLAKPEGCDIRHGWIVVNNAGLFWKNSDSFVVKYGGQTIATCPVSAGSCNISFSNIVIVPPPGQATPVVAGGADIRLFISDRGVTLLNVSVHNMDVSRLVFESSSGSFEAWRWSIPELTRPLTAFTPGDCLQVWSLDTNYLNPLPECRERHAWLQVAQSEQFWLNADSFTVREGETMLATCSISAGICDVDLPNQ